MTHAYLDFAADETQSYQFAVRVDLATETDKPAELWVDADGKLKPLELAIPKGALPTSGRVVFAIPTPNARHVRLRARCSNGDGCVSVEFQ